MEEDKRRRLELTEEAVVVVDPTYSGPAGCRKGYPSASVRKVKDGFQRKRRQKANKKTLPTLDGVFNPTMMDRGRGPTSAVRMEEPIKRRHENTHTYLRIRHRPFEFLPNRLNSATQVAQVRCNPCSAAALAEPKLYTQPQD